MLNNIFIEMEKKSISKMEFCKLLSVSDKTLSSWVNENRSIPASKLFLMCKILNCSSDYLLNQI